MRVALGDLWVILGPLWRHDAYMWGLGRAVFDLVLVRSHILEGQDSQEEKRKTNNEAKRVTLGSLWGRCWVSLGSLFVFLGHFEVTLGI